MASTITSGYVIRPLRVSPSNSENTSVPTNGVVRDVKPIPPGYDIPLAGQVFDIAADQYRAAVLEGPNQDSVEYLVWAANNSNMALVEDDTWAISEGAASIPEGDIPVLDVNSGTGQRPDGTDRLVITDNGGRSIFKVLSLKVVRGDDPLQTETELFLATDFVVDDPDTGVLTLLDNATTQAALTPVAGNPAAFSSLRRDRITEVVYVLARSRFWWTRNDSYFTRFGWNGRTQRWEPLKGAPPVNLGTLEVSETYTLFPRPTGIVEGSYLPGDTNPDAYTMIRLGTSPDSTSVPVAPNPGGPFEGVLVVSDAEASGVYNFSALAPPPSAVVGVTSGLVQWNQDFVNLHAGKPFWYVPQGFSSESTGRIGLLLDVLAEPMFITPIPTPEEHPFIRIGSRRYLSVVTVDTEADLIALVVTEGIVGVALSTGLLKFSDADISKADPHDAGFDIRYLDAVVFYDGVSLNSVPQPTRGPVACHAGLPPEATETPIGTSNLLYVRDASPLPGLGISGILQVEDGTGAVPTTGTAGLRSGGDDPLDPYTALLRQVEGIGDVIMFTRLGSFGHVNVVDTAGEIPALNFEIPEGELYLTRKVENGVGSLVGIGSTDRQTHAGELLYFLQAEMTPARYTEEARLISKVLGVFVLSGVEKLYFALDGILYTWDASVLGQGTYTAQEIADSIDAIITGTGQAVDRGGHVALEAGDTLSGTVEIGFGGTSEDLSGASALGFVPGWRVDTADPDTFWLVDSGISVGLFRSAINLDRQSSVADFQERSRFSDEVLVSSIPPTSFTFLTNPPLRDIAGYDEDVFFKLGSGRVLRYAQDMDYMFTDEPPKFSWLGRHIQEGAITRETSSLNLQRTNLTAASFLEEVGGGLFVSEDGGPLVRLELGEDFLLDQGGAPGTVTLIEKIGGRSSSGFQGTFSASGTTFTDLTATFLTEGVSSGNLLTITNGPLSGQSFAITSVTSETSLEVSPAFPEDNGTSVASWQIFEGFGLDVYDPSLIADVVYDNFSHMLEEPFQVRLFTAFGTIPADEADQELNRLYAPVLEAIALGRTFTFRFDLGGLFPATPVLLTTSILGTIAQDTLFIPEPASDRFKDGAFSLRLGSTLFLNGVNLFRVISFSTPIPPGTIEYLGTGQIRFADDVFSDYSLSQVQYEEEFIRIDFLSETFVEVDPETGALNFSEDDLARHGGKTGYLVEEMLAGVDVVLSPLTNSFLFRRPLREGQIVEAQYFVADRSGDKAVDEDGNFIEVKEFLPLAVRSEVATRISSQQYAFNPTGRTISGDTFSDYTVYIDINRQNYGSRLTAFMDVDDDRIYFQGVQVAPTSVVTISYFVLEAFGGESSYTTSQGPIFRKPFFLEAGQSTFGLETDRTAEMVPGKMLRLGARPLYIKASSYSAVTDLTTVEIFPVLDVEAGSRAPANDVLSLLTSIPISPEVDGVPTLAPAGFMLEVLSPFDPIRVKQNQVRFQGDLTRFAVPGHVLEIGGVPYLVVDASQSEDGNSTTVEVSSPFLQEYVFGTDIVKISVRPVYPSGARLLLGAGAIIPTEDFAVILFEMDENGDPLPGRTLEQGFEYEIDFATGNVSLIEGNQEGLSPGQRYYVQFTRLKTLGPRLSSGFVVIPRFRAEFSFVDVASEQNQLLGDKVFATYTFRSPDSFFFRVETLEEYLAEVRDDQISQVSAQTPGGGPIVAVIPVLENQDRGVEGLDGQRRGLLDKDRAGRVLLSFYSEVITAFEQIKETISGQVVGDRDGKFRFFVGRGATFTPPGYEDEVTGYLNPRNVWSDVFLSETSGLAFPLRHLQQDNLVDPSTASLSSAILEGDIISPDRLEVLLREQQELVLNDVDDTLLLQRGTLKAVFDTSIPPLLVYQVLGEYHQMDEAHAFSRIFPTRTRAFTTTLPGLGADPSTGYPGVYAFRRTIQNPDGSTSVVSTFKQTIAVLSNPVLGVITNITDASISARLARARVVSYSEDGFGVFEAATSGRPTLMLSQVPLAEFPIDETTGYPDVNRLRSQSASADAVPDIETGDPDLHVPPFRSIQIAAGSTVYDSDPQQIVLGKPDGSFVELFFARNKITVQGVSQFRGIVIDKVYQGSVATLRGSEGASGEVTSPSDLITLDAQGIPVPVVIEPGDTILVISPVGEDSALSDPLTQEDIQKLAAGQSVFRIGVDLDLDKQTGEVIDITQSSFADPSNLAIKELLGQNPPDPQEPIEANISFNNFRVEPLLIPALQGTSRSDSGDEEVPYGPGLLVELEALQDGSVGALGVYQDGPGPVALYPNEIQGENGQILGALAGPLPPATLIVSEDVTPVATAGSYTPNSGIGDVQQGDLLLIQVDDSETSLPRGAQGILEIGSLSYTPGVGSFLEPPRFVSPSREGDRIRYVFENAMSHISASGSGTGIIIEEVGGDTILDISSVVGLFLDDGNGTNEGGLNHIFPMNAVLPGANENRIIFRIFDKTTGSLLETLTFSGDPFGVFFPGEYSARGGLGTMWTPTDPVIGSGLFIINTTGFVDFVALGAVAPGPVGPFNFTITVDTATPGLSALPDFVGSYTAAVSLDRLTFTEKFDLRTALPRGSSTGVEDVEASLDVVTITSPDTDALTVNGKDEVNGSQPFTFLERVLGVIGSFTPASAGGAGDESGSVKVMGYEGFGNQPVISSNPVQFSAVPSSSVDANGPICTGVGEADGNTNQYDNKIIGIQVSTGALANVRKGDITIIETASDTPAPVFPGAWGNTKSGTYLVRQVLESDNPGVHPRYREVTLEANIGDGYGWVDARFPTVVSFDRGLGTLTVSNLFPFSASPTGHAFASTGRVYLVLSVADLDSAVFAEYSNAVVSAAYTGVNDLTKEITGLNDYRDAGGNAILDIDFEAVALPGVTVSGMVYFSIQVGGEQGLPPDNIVGIDDIDSVYGVRNFTLVGVVPSSATQDLVLQKASGEVVKPAGAIAGALVVDAKVPVSPSVFQINPISPVYSDIPGLLNIENFDATQWENIHKPVAHPSTLVECVLPGEVFVAGETGISGFRAMAGIFFEPTWRTPIFDLDGASAHVVDATHTLPFAEVGMRRVNDYAPVAVTTPEVITFSVRRTRRFSDSVDMVSSAVAALEYTYDIRQGVVTGYSSTPNQLGILEALDGTQLGNFTEELVNINAGDLLRLLDTDGSVLEEVSILGVRSSIELLLAAPGLTTSPVGKTFEIYLRRPYVPHSQSLRQLLNLMTEEVVMQTLRNDTTGAGGFVQSTGTYAADVNILRDTNVTGVGNDTYAARGVQVGDYLVIDPAGELNPPGAPNPLEVGSRPFGDDGVVVRPGTYTAGKPSPLDDNRGFYRVVVVNPDNLVVAGESTFAGDSASGDVLFGDSGSEYALYPTIHASGLTGGAEGQNDLRPTSYSVGGTHSTNDLSVAPFSYQILRFTSLLSQDAVELVLMMRERLYSWREALGQGLALGDGTYYVFQRDEHMADLVGIALTNTVLNSLVGRVEVAPFVNTADAVSFLDRRFWLLDFQLDSAAPLSGGPPFYSSFLTGSGRPVLPDHIELVLGGRDNLRDFRRVWLEFRTHRITGTLAAIRRFEARLEELMKGQRDLIRFRNGTG